MRAGKKAAAPASRPTRQISSGPRSRAFTRQRGYTAVFAVMLVVLLALVGAQVASLGRVASASALLSWYGMQAWFAARSGFEWAARQATAGQASHDAICGSPAVTTHFDLTLAGQSFALSVTCDDRGGFQEAGRSYEVDAISVTATHGASADLAHVSRTVEATVTRGLPLPP